MLFAIVPQALDQILRDERSLWVTSNLGYAAIHSFHYLIQVRRIGTSTAAGDAIIPVSRSAGGALFVGGILLIMTQVALAGFGDSAQLRFVYLVALTWHSSVAGVMFGGLVLRFLSSDAA